MEEKEIKYVVWYARVSSYEQAQKNLSIPMQVQQIKEYAAMHGYEIKQIYEEKHSAFKWKRPIFHQMLKDIKKDKDITWLVVAKWDRISRNAWDYLSLEELIKNNNLQVISIAEPIINSIVAKHMIRISQSESIYYSEQLSFRTKLWMRAKLQSWGSIWWTTPFGFSYIKWKLVPDEDKSHIVKFVFEQYSSGSYWYRELAKLVQKKYKIKRFTRKRVNHMIMNSIYAWYYTKTWKLWPEEYLIWWYDKPWTYTETYEVNYITPIISKELYDKCQKLRWDKLRYKWAITWKAAYPMIFHCICWRTMRRDDKKGIKYLCCSRHINNRFPVKCTEKYTHLDDIADNLYEIISKIIPSKNIRNKMIDYINEEMSQESKNKNLNILDIKAKIEDLKNKLSVLTTNFINDQITKDIFEESSSLLNEQINLYNERLSPHKDNKKYIKAWKKAVEFIEILWKYEKVLNDYKKNKKSSHLFSLIFNIVANSVIYQKRVHTYALFPPFNILQNNELTEWGEWRDLNPRPLESQSSALPTELHPPYNKVLNNKYF